MQLHNMYPPLETPKQSFDNLLKNTRVKLVYKDAIHKDKIKISNFFIATPLEIFTAFRFPLLQNFPVYTK